MPVQTLSFPWPSKRFVIRGAVAASLATLAAVAMAQEFPVFRKGLWEFNRTVDGGGTGKTQTMTTKKCADPTNDMKKQNAMLTKVGCTFSPVAKHGTSYTFTSQCNVQGVSAQSKSVISVEGDSAYRVNVESRQGGQGTKELLVARRIGDC
jgi:hypothetical protein